MPVSATMADVARAAGVSQMTVSRVLNRPANVSPPTRQRVAHAISELSYTPNPAARSLAATRVRVGLLYGSPGAFFLSEFLIGAFDGAATGGAELLIEHCEPATATMAAIDRLVARGIDGVVLPPPLCESGAVIDHFVERDIPVVAIASGEPIADIPSIGIDDRAAARAMTSHLAGLGHRRIGFIAGAPGLAASGKRFDGYRLALDEAGIPADPALVAAGDFTYRSGLDAADRLLAVADRPTAVFASNDDMAAAVIAVAHGMGLDVPGDVTVCGFDDTGFATSIWPALTTVRQPIGEMARIALPLLARHVRNGEGRLTAAHRLLAFEIVRRQSDAIPRRIT